MIRSASPSPPEDKITDTNPEFVVFLIISGYSDHSSDDEIANEIFRFMLDDVMVYWKMEAIYKFMSGKKELFKREIETMRIADKVVQHDMLEAYRIAIQFLYS